MCQYISHKLNTKINGPLSSEYMIISLMGTSLNNDVNVPKRSVIDHSIVIIVNGLLVYIAGLIPKTILTAPANIIYSGGFILAPGCSYKVSRGAVPCQNHKDWSTKTATAINPAI